MYGEDYEYANSRIAQTFVKKDGKFIFVHEVGPDGTVRYNNVGSRVDYLCKLSEINVKPSPLGFVNVHKTCIYLARAPMRRDWRQGMRELSLRVIEQGGVVFGPNYVRDFGMQDIVKGLNKGYPTFKDSLKTMATGLFDRVSWNKDWAMDSGNRLLWRGCKIVGKVVNSVPCLDDEFTYLKESLQESYE